MPDKKPKLEVVEEELPPAPATPPATDEVTLAEIPFRGITFTIPQDMDEWETEACLALSQGDYVLSAKLLLGPGQWTLLKTLGSRRKDVREFLLVFADVINRDCIG